MFDFDASLYFRKGKRYYPLPDACLFRLYREGIPSDGIWLIKNDGRVAQRIGELPSPTRIDLEWCRDQLTKEVSLQLESMKSASVNDFASMLLDAVSNVLEVGQ